MPTMLTAQCIYWHLADNSAALTFVLHCECPLLGVKRTSKFEAVMSAYDPKRTLLFAKLFNADEVFDKDGR